MAATSREEENVELNEDVETSQNSEEQQNDADEQIKQAVKEIKEGNKTEEPEEEVDETAKLKEQLLRAMAETENVRKRAERDIEEASKYAATSFARDMIAVLDNLYRAEQSLGNSDDNGEKTVEDILKSFSEGVALTKNELINIFDRHGIKRVDPLNEKFDYNLHQAMVQIENDEVEAGTVLQVMQLGYVIKDRLLRPAMVAVSKKPIVVEPEDFVEEDDA